MTNNNNSKNNKNKPSARKGPAGGRSSAQRKPAVSQAVGVSYSTNMRNSMPVFSQSKDGLRIAHREYVADVGAISTTFGIATVLNLNPGLSGTFPWLSALAENFEVYEFHKLRFIFQSASPTSTAGTIFMAIDYDAADATPTTKPEFMSNMTAVSSSVWAANSIDYDCSMKHYMSNRFTRNSTLAGNLDIKTYDAGYLMIAGEGASLAVPGNIYVEYDVSLRIPQIPTDTYFADSMKVYSSAGARLSGITDNLSGNYSLLNSLAGTLSQGNWIFGQAGQYLVVYAVNGTTTAMTSAIPTWSITSGDAVVTDGGYAAITTSGVGVYQAILNVADAGATLRLVLDHIVTIVDYTLRLTKYGYTIG